MRQYRWMVCFFFLSAAVFSLDIEKKNFDLTYLDTIDFSVPAHLIITQGRKNEYSIEGSQQTLSRIKVALIPGGDLKIEPKDVFPPQDFKDLTVFVTLKDLQKLKIGKNVKVSMRDLVLTKLTLFVDDLSFVKAEIILEDLVVQVEGSPRIDLKGSAKRQFLEVKGSPYYIASKFKTAETRLDIDGSGEIYVKATNKLVISLVGDAKVYYLGTPKEFDHKISGRGIIRKI